MVKTPNAVNDEAQIRTIPEFLLQLQKRFNASPAHRASNAGTINPAMIAHLTPNGGPLMNPKMARKTQRWS
jgi:hypothetical protein